MGGRNICVYEEWNKGDGDNMKDPLDFKIKRVFPSESVYKIRDNYGIFDGKNISSFIKDWLVKKFTTDDGVLDKKGLLDYLERFIPQKETAKKIKGDLVNNKNEYKVLTRVIIDADVKGGIIRFAIPDLEISLGEGIIQKYLAEKYKELLGGEVWGVFTLAYVPPEEKGRGYITVVDYKPFKPYEVDLDYFREGRKEFSLEEWIDLLIRSMEYNPAGFQSLEQKLLFLSRLLVFVEPRLNMIELAPKGTGKSYIFNNLSKYGWCISGGTVTRAKMFYDISKHSFGFIVNYDFVAIDEIQTIKFSDKDELRGALKNYLESGKFTVANVAGSSDAGIILLGNITLDQDLRPINYNYFQELPEFFQESALLDRFHGFVEGWRLPRINEDMKVKGYTLNVEYFSEILHSLRNCLEFPSIVDELIEIPRRADTRDVNAIKRLSSGYLKLLYPHIKSPNDIDREEFKNFCLNLAMEKRRIIRKQIHIIDLEFREEIPDIRVRSRWTT